MSELKCPYCDNESYIDSEDFTNEDEFAETQCNECEKYFTYTTHISISHEGFKTPCLNGEPHNYVPLKTFPAYFTKMSCEMCADRRDPTDEERTKYKLPFTYEP